MGVSSSRSQLADRPRNKFLMYAFIALTVCCIVILVIMVIFLIMLNRVNEQTQSMLVASLNTEINATAGEETGFSGTLYNISDELLDEPTLTELGRQEEIEPGFELTAAQNILRNIIERTAGTGAERYLYFSRSDYLIDADQPDINARGSMTEPVEAMLDELGSDTARTVGSYENHVGSYGGSNYQLMVSTVAPDVYYLVYFPSFYAEIPDSFSAFEDTQLYYYDKFGDSIACSDLTDILGAFTYDSLGDEDTGVVYWQQGGRDYMGVYCTSHSRDVRLAIFFIDDIATLNNAATIAFILMAVIVVACLVITIVLINSFYRPVRTLARRLRQSPDLAGPSDENDATASAGTGFLQDDSAVIAEALDTYQTKVKRQQDLLNITWMWRLLSNNDPDELSDYEDSWVAGLQGDRYTVVVICSDATVPEHALHDTVETYLGSTFDCRLVSIPHQVVAIVSLNGTSETALIDELKRMQTEQADLELSAFIGRPRTSLEEISACFNEAMAATDYCLTHEIYDVVERYEDISDIQEERQSEPEAMPINEEAANGQTLFETIKEAVQENYRDVSLSAGSLARQAGVSQSQITKLFRKYNDSTFLEYLHNIRLTEATLLLTNTALTESEIARRVGYNSTVTMIRAFRKYRGIIPSSLRKN